MLIKAVFFDFGGTLFDYLPSNYQLLGSIARKYGIGIEDTDPLLSMAFQRQEEYMVSLFRSRGEPKYSLLSKQDWIKLDEILLDVIGLKSPQALDELIARFEEREFEFQLFPETIDTIKYLRDEKFRLGIISNLSGHSRVSERYAQLQELDLLSLFDVITMSGEIGFSKPNPEIFLMSVGKLDGIKAGESMFIGDSYFFDVLGARAAGMVPVLLDQNLGTDYGCMKIASIKELIPLIDVLSCDE